MAKSSAPNKIIHKSLAWMRKLLRKDEFDFLGYATLPIKTGDEPIPTRVGVDIGDKNTPFVETRLGVLYNWYHGYKNSRAYNQWVAYCDIVLLHKDGSGFASGQNVSDLSISILPEAYSVPMSFSKHAEVAVDVFKRMGKIYIMQQSGEYENNISARIISWSNDPIRIEVQKADYFSQVGSNITMDWANDCLGKYNTIRNSIERPRNGKLPSLKKSLLANTLGVATFIYTADEQILIPIRGNNQAIMSEGRGKFHCSASGVFKWESIDKDETFDGLANGMHDEISRELNIPVDSYQLIPLAFAREFARGGKPQLFFCAKSTLTLKDIRKQMTSAEEKWEFMDEEDLPSDSPLQKWLSKRDSVDINQRTIEECFTYEGWMGLLLTHHYLNNQYPF